MRSWARTSLAAGVILLALTPPSCGRSPSGRPPRRARQRVLVMGFDGMDTTLARKWMDEGKLPNLKHLAEGGTLATLRTTQPVDEEHSPADLRGGRTMVAAPLPGVFLDHRGADSAEGVLPSDPVALVETRLQVGRVRQVLALVDVVSPAHRAHHPLNRKVAGADPGIADLSPTVLRLLNVPLPPDLDGKPLM